MLYQYFPKKEVIAVMALEAQANPDQADVSSPRVSRARPIFHSL